MSKKKIADWASKALQVGSEVADLAIHLKTGGPVALVAVGTRILHSVQRMMPQEKINWFFEKKWQEVVLPDEVLDEILTTSYQKPSVDEDDAARIYEIHGQRVGVQVTGEDKNTWITWMPPETKVEAWYPAIGRFLWEKVGTSWAVWDSGDGVESGKDLCTDSLPSQTAIDIFEAAKPFLDKGFPRSLLLHGPPGVGKSGIMRYVRHLAGGLSLRIEASTLEHFAADNLQLVRILRPDVLLLDDIDRVKERKGSKGQMCLSFLENVRNEVKLVLASANFIREMDPAALRAGRWDKLIEIQSLDEAIIDKLIGDQTPEDIADRLRKLPVAYIHEFHRRRDVLGLEMAISSIEELVAQAEIVDQLCQRRED